MFVPMWILVVYVGFGTLMQILGYFRSRYALEAVERQMRLYEQTCQRVCAELEAFRRNTSK